MSYDHALAERVRTELSAVPGIAERRMFGGLSFLVNGNMCCGLLEDRLVLRLGTAGVRAAVLREHTSPMDFTGRPLQSMVYVSAAGIASDHALRRWLQEAVGYAAALPAK